MSKGHGKIERAILEALSMKRGKRGPHFLGATTEELARYVVSDMERQHGWSCSWSGPAPTRSQLESVRRALRNLRKQGLIIEPKRYPQRIYYEMPGKKPTVL